MDKYFKLIKKKDPKAKISRKELQAAYRASILYTWEQAGLKEYYFGDKKVSEEERRKAKKELKKTAKYLESDGEL